MLPWSNKITKTFITKYLLETAKSPVVVGEKQILGVQKVIIFRKEGASFIADLQQVLKDSCKGMLNIRMYAATYYYVKFTW